MCCSLLTVSQGLTSVSYSTILHNLCPSRSVIPASHGMKSGGAPMSISARLTTKAAAQKCVQVRESTALRMAGEEGDAAAAVGMPEPPVPPVPEKSNLPFYLDPSTRRVGCYLDFTDCCVVSCWKLSWLPHVCENRNCCGYQIHAPCRFLSAIARLVVSAFMFISNHLTGVFHSSSTFLAAVFLHFENLQTCLESGPGVCEWLSDNNLNSTHLVQIYFSLRLSWR